MLTILISSKSIEPFQIAGWRVCALVGDQVALLNNIALNYWQPWYHNFCWCNIGQRKWNVKVTAFTWVKHGHVNNVDANVDVSQCIPLWTCITLMIDKSWSPHACLTVNLTRIEGIVTHSRIDAYCLVRWLINLLVKAPPL